MLRSIILNVIAKYFIHIFRVTIDMQFYLFTRWPDKTLNSMLLFMPQRWEKN